MVSIMKTTNLNLSEVLLQWDIKSNAYVYAYTEAIEING